MISFEKLKAVLRRKAIREPLNSFFTDTEISSLALFYSNNDRVLSFLLDKMRVYAFLDKKEEPSATDFLNELKKFVEAEKNIKAKEELGRISRDAEKKKKEKIKKAKEKLRGLI